MRRSIVVALTLAFLLDAPANAGIKRDESAIAAARERARKWLFEQGPAWGIGDADKQLKETDAQELSTSIVFRFQQVHGGVPVHAANLVVSVNRRGVRATSGLIVGLRVDTTPSITARDAEAIAIANRRLTVKPDVLESTLVIMPASRLAPDVPHEDRLVWRVDLATDKEAGGSISRVLFIDAHTSEIWSDDDAFVHATYVPYPPEGRGAYIRGSFRAAALLNNTQTALSKIYVQDYCYGHGQAISEPEAPSRCTHSDPAVPNYRVLDGRGNWVGNANNKDIWTGKPLEFLSTTYGDGIPGSPDFRTPAADAIAAVESVFDYLYFSHQHAGLDRNNGPVVHALVRAPVGGNARWSPQYRAIQLGGGDTDHYDAATLDVVAHEIGHALSDYGPRLDLRYETAQIGEATANMFAMLVSERSDLDEIPHWIGEQLVKRNYVGNVFSNPTQALTYMDDPARRPGTIACYYPDIGMLGSHRGAGPGNHMFYLLTYGGTSTCNGNIVEGVGMAASERIWYEGFHRLGSAATYTSLRQAFVQAALELFPGPSLVAQNTVAAFDAVNVPQP